jgi:hypothetical protein
MTTVSYTNYSGIDVYVYLEGQIYKDGSFVQNWDKTDIICKNSDNIYVSNTGGKTVSNYTQTFPSNRFLIAGPYASGWKMDNPSYFHFDGTYLVQDGVSYPAKPEYFLSTDYICVLDITNPPVFSNKSPFEEKPEKDSKLDIIKQIDDYSNDNNNNKKKDNSNTTTIVIIIVIISVICLVLFVYREKIMNFIGKG